MPALLETEFRKRFNKEPEKIFFCPGRVNLIGEHIDYNGGKVLPCAIQSGTWLAISRNIEKLLRFQCLDFPETAALHLQTSYTKSGKEWFNYPLGVINELLESERGISGLDMLFHGDLPIGAGLSSSASVEVVTAFAISDLFGLMIPGKELALLAQKAENNFIGVNCGIMDQFAVAMGKKDNAILLNCDTLDYDYIPLVLKDHSLVVINTNKQRKLAESKYNERFAECGAALKALKSRLEIDNLCALDPLAFEKNKDIIPDDVLKRRAAHVVYENDRVKKAAVLLSKNDMQGFGDLLFESHRSLKQLYEVSGPELDAIVEYASDFKGCAGARMTGAGFGGCAIALIEKGRMKDFESGLSSFYNSKIGYAPSMIISDAAEGVRAIVS